MVTDVPLGHAWMASLGCTESWVAALAQFAFGGDFWGVFWGRGREGREVRTIEIRICIVFSFDAQLSAQLRSFRLCLRRIIGRRFVGHYFSFFPRSVVAINQPHNQHTVPVYLYLCSFHNHGRIGIETTQTSSTEIEHL